MKLTRRQFMVIVAAVSAGCDRSADQRKPTSATTPTSRPDEPTTKISEAVDAGAIGDFPPNTVSDVFRDQGFFVIHRDQKVLALSSVCTHKGCKVRLAKDQSFYCKCHGSTFDADGHVTKGPATRDLPRLMVATDDRNHVFVRPA
jgi:Rieske Fe-S protein